MEEYNHIDNESLIQSRNLYNRCKCDKCQERVALMDKIIDYRNSSNKKQKVNKAEGESHRERLSEKTYYRNQNGI